MSSFFRADFDQLQSLVGWAKARSSRRAHQARPWWARFALPTLRLLLVPAIPIVAAPCQRDRDRPRIKSGGDEPGDDESAATSFAPLTWSPLQVRKLPTYLQAIRSKPRVPRLASAQREHELRRIGTVSRARATRRCEALANAYQSTICKRFASDLTISRAVTKAVVRSPMIRVSLNLMSRTKV